MGKSHPLTVAEFGKIVAKCYKSKRFKELERRSNKKYKKMIEKVLGKDFFKHD
jgi:hypothetical protein